MTKRTPMGMKRRQFLRGIGVCMALPALESMQSAKALAFHPTELAITASGAPLRTAFIYFPNGAIPAAWWPAATAGGGDAKSYAISQTLKPLEPLRDSIQVLKGLDNLSADGGRDGGGDHARGNGTFLTGVRLKKSASDIQAGVSIDQVIAKSVGDSTRFASLEMTCDSKRQTSGCDSGYSCAYQYNISWSSATTPMSPESNPRSIFERLFGAGNPGERNDSLARRRNEQKSVLDFVLEDARSMQRRLPSSDRDKLGQYLDGIRDIEKRIEKSERFGAAKDPEIETPAGVPDTYEKYIQLTYDLLFLAFQTDSTRVASLLLAHDGSNRSFDHIGIVEGHHDLTHHQNKVEQIKKVQEIDQWYVRMFSGFLDKLARAEDVDGKSLLYNSMIIYGSGNADGNRHTHSDLPIVLAGNAGGALTPGRFVDHRSKPLTNLYLSMADRMGVQDLKRFGDSTDRLGDL